MNGDSSIREIRGIGDKTAGLFHRLGIYTLRDLMFYYPRTYETMEAPVPVRTALFRDRAAVRGVLTGSPTVRYVKKLNIVNAVLRDEEGASLSVSWFNMPYLSKSLHAGAQYVFYGNMKGNGPYRRMEQPKLYKPDDYTALSKTLQPVYSLVKGLSRKTLQDAIRKALESGWMPEETLEEKLRSDYGLIPLRDALREIHFPEGEAALIPARRRLVFEEFYRFIINVRRLKERVEQEPNTFKIRKDPEVDRLIGLLPYELTGAQQRTLKEVTDDLLGDRVMNRLIQGDVGSGKTIVAFLAMYMTALSGYQSVLMAPTEVLAKQHYENFCRMTEEYGLSLSTVLLTGSMGAAEKKKVYETIASHRADIIVGTHALIQDAVHYDAPALVITDEQHRFGVSQRKTLGEKGGSPHVLVMSATPIPRTLAMILYGDMDISVMDELPKNRLPIKNAVVDVEYRPKAYRFIEKQVREGHQAYVICPLVEESELSSGENVQDYVKILRAALAKDIRVEALTGPMKNDEKEAVMAAFSRNEIQVLVSTTVIEVGIDVRNATVMMIENAERFGLAQLHQLRGRVGRGDAQSYCIFVDSTMSEESQKRLAVLKESNDGFHIASEDLKLRGPGDLFGIRQSGEVSFRLADIYNDAAILKEAEEAASKTLNDTVLPAEAAVL